MSQKHNESNSESKAEHFRPKLSDYFDLEIAEAKLRALCGHTRKGNDQDYRSPLFGGRPREDVLNEWQSTLEPGLTGMEGLLEFENDLRQKVGPLSIQKPLSERIEDVEAYYAGIHLPATPLSSEATAMVAKKWRSKIGGLTVRDIGKTWDNMKKSTSAGAPTMGKKSEFYARYGLPQFVSGEICDPELSGKLYHPIAILGWRGQEGGLSDDDVKQRVIWMFPFGVNLEELSVYQPMIQGAQVTGLNPAWNGMEAVDKTMTELFRTKAKQDFVICTDFTKFDQHFNPECASTAKRLLEAILHKDKVSTYWLDEVYDVKYTIPLLCDLDLAYKGLHGMGSGSGGTNADESLTHEVLQTEAALRAHSELNPNSMRLGDDGLLTFPGIDLDAVLSCYTSHGLEMNESKQMVSKSEAVYLRRWYSNDYVGSDGIMHGVYSTYRALGKLMGYERLHDPDDWSPEMEVIRALSIIENVKYHPMREEFLKFCVKGDKFRLGLDIPGFFEHLATFVESSELAQSFRSYTAGDNIGINSWWVVNALKEMR